MAIKDQYSGVQYPDQEELEKAQYLMKLLKVNFSCVDPMEEWSDKFKERISKLRNIKEIIMDTFSGGEAASPDMFATDLPLNLFEFMRDKIFEDLI